MQVFKQLFKKKQARLGIDISSTAVKVIQLDRVRNGYRVVAYAIEPLPPGSVQDKNIVDQEAVAAAIVRALGKARTKLRHAVLAVPGSATVSRVVSVPGSLKEFELEETIKLEANSFIPYPIDEVSLDFEVIGKTAANPDNIDVLVVATRSENVDSRVAVCELAGLTTDIVDVESFAVENTYKQMIAPTLSEEERTLPVALLDIGANTTTIHVFDSDGIIHTREHNFGGYQLTEEIARHYEISTEEASQKQRSGDLPEDYTRHVLQPFIDTAATQIERFIQFYYSAGQGGNIGLLLIGGGTANTPGLIERIAKETGIPARLANPFMNTQRASSVSAEALANDGSALLIASGLALRSFD